MQRPVVYQSWPSWMDRFACRSPCAAPPPRSAWRCSSRCPPLPAATRKATCRSCATPRSRRWFATTPGRSSRPPGSPSPASTSCWSTIASFNAFVAGRRMFINTGALLQAETPNEIIGVIAHEAGHIAGGHQDRLREQLARAQTMAVIGIAARCRRDGRRGGNQHRRTCRRRRRHRGGRQRSGKAQPAQLPAHRGSRPPTNRRSNISRRPGSRAVACS